jgi:hypothetical protein
MEGAASESARAAQKILQDYKMISFALICHSIATNVAELEGECKYHRPPVHEA